MWESARVGQRYPLTQREGYGANHPTRFGGHVELVGGDSLSTIAFNI